MANNPHKITVASLLAGILLVLFAAPAFAQEYVTYITQPGDSLSKIAARFCTNWEDIYRINRGAIGPNPGIMDATIRLSIPAYCNTGGSSPNIPSGGQTGWDRGPKVHATGSYSAPYYTVAWGDTLTSIGQRFGLSVAAIQGMNGLSSSNISPGQVLIVSAVSGSGGVPGGDGSGDDGGGAMAPS